MIATKRSRRIVIIVDASLRDQFLEKIVELGARDYNYTDCVGRGMHAVTGDPFTGDSLVRIEILTTDQTAAAIMDSIHAAQSSQFSRYALTAFMDNVEIDARHNSPMT